MSRTTTRSPHARPRNSRVVEKGDSPFRKPRGTTRQRAAEVMVDKRRRELVALQALALEAETTHERRQLSLRIAATKASMGSWTDYLAKNYPLVPNATVRP